MSKQKIATIVVRSLIDYHSAISDKDGDKLCDVIDEKLGAGMSVTVSFKSIDMIVPTFLNAGIGQLYGKHKWEILDDRIEFTDLEDENDRLVIEKVIESAKKYFTDKKRMDKIIDEEFNGDT